VANHEPDRRDSVRSTRTDASPSAIAGGVFVSGTSVSGSSVSSRAAPVVHSLTTSR
jgi:hypothetical protein